MSGMQHTEGDPTALLSGMPHVCAQNVTIRSDFTIPHRYIGLSCFILLYFHPSKPMYDTILFRIRVQYDLVTFLGTMQATDLFLYDINLRAMHTMILSIRGVMILIYLVSRAMDSFGQRVVLFKSVTVLTSDPKSEFLCQSSSSCTEPADSPEHLVCLGYLPCPRHHVSPIQSQSQCSNRVPEAEALSPVG